MRKNETEIQEMLAAHGLNLTTVFAEDRYFEALADVTDPEKKELSESYSSGYSRTKARLVQSAGSRNHCSRLD